jgi:uncharacterized membrane protein
MSNTVAPRRNYDWLIPAGLIVLSVVPVVAGSVRLVELAGTPEVTPQNARFVAMPIPVVIHIVSVTIYCLLGAFQFHSGFRRRHPRWHRNSGRILLPCGIAAALSGLWMTQFYPPPVLDGTTTLYVIRLAVGAAMFVFLIAAFAAIRRGDVATHSAFMIRAYALGIGAGTQVLTHIPFLVFGAELNWTTRTAAMAAGWAINIAGAEWVIWRMRTAPQRRAAAAA